MGGAHRIARLAASVAAGLLTLSLVLAGGLYLRLAAGPIDVAGYAPQIVAAFSDRMQGAGLTLGSAEIALDEDGGASVRLSDVLLLDEGGEPFARIPKAVAHFGLWDAIRGRFEPTGVTLTGVSGRLERDEEGRFSFGFGGLEGAETGDGVGPFSRLLAAATAEGEGGGAPNGAAAEASGQLIRLEDASILYFDRFAGRVYRARDADLSFWRAPAGTFGGAEIALDGGRHGAVTVRMTGRRTESGDVSLRASFENAAPRDIAGQIRALDWMAAFDAPVSGEIDLAMDAAGDLTALSGSFEAGAGRLRLDENTVEPFAGARLAYVFDPEYERFEIEEVALDADRAALRG
ncbi:MAG: hypothetical protein AAF322_13845, partial [Pseudomonadota bacterium]